MASSLFVSFLILIPSHILLLLPLTNADAGTDIITRNCTGSQDTDRGDFYDIYGDAMEKLKSQINDMEFFALASAGTPEKRLYLLAQCHGDVENADDCQRCLSSAGDILCTCYPQTAGQVYLDSCFLRLAHYNFFYEISIPQDSEFCGTGLDDTAIFRHAVKELLTQLIKSAPDGNGYAKLDQKLDEKTDKKIYGLANCWKTLDHKACSDCLTNASMDLASSCLPATEGRAVKAGCIMHYRDTEITRNPSDMIPENKADLYVFVIYGGVITTLAISLGFFFGKIYYNHKNRRQRKLKGMNSNSLMFKRTLRFKYSTLEKATNQFSESNKLGQGGFGEVYKGILVDGREIAVKRLFICSNNKYGDAYNEMNVISHAQHQNLVRFLGCCITNSDNLLVYEFLPNKSLDNLLFDPERKKELDWKRRRGIIIGTAEGLKYLHTECEEKIIHRDIKASNILLDFKYRPKIADFGLARFYESDNTPLSTPIAGTLGYMAPEYIARGKLSEKTDVYSYGVVVLELISGARNNTFKSEESLETLVASAWKFFKANTVSEIIDEGLETDEKEEVIRFVQVGLLCTQEIDKLRPTMKEIIQMLTDKDIELAQPSKPPFVDESLEISCFQDASNRQSLSCNPQTFHNDSR